MNYAMTCNTSDKSMLLLQVHMCVSNVDMIYLRARGSLTIPQRGLPSPRPSDQTV